MSNNNEKNKPMVQNVSCILPENSQLGGLFLGNVFGAQNAAILKQYGIRAIITASIETNINHSPEDIPFHLKFQAHDKEDYYITEHINECIHFIEQKRKLTNVYVHCYAGVSRSSAIVAAYLMWKYRWTLKKTLAFLVCKRIVVKPNDGFMKQLKEVEIKLNIHPQQQRSRQISAHQQNIITMKQKITVKPKYPFQQQITMNQQYADSYPAKPTVINTNPLSPALNIQNINKTNNYQSQYSLTHQNIDIQETNMAKGQLNTNRNYQRNKNQQKISVKQYSSHKNIPIPKVLQKKMQQTQRNSLYQNDNTMQTTKKVSYNNSSKPFIPTSPNKRISTITNAYNNNFNKEGQVYLNNLNNNSVNNTMKVNESRQKAKLTSRCLIRPKDLPGYKNY